MIDEETVPNSYLHKRSTLKIKFSQDLREGTYECRVTYGGRTESRQFLVQVDKSEVFTSCMYTLKYFKNCLNLKN